MAQQKKKAKLSGKTKQDGSRALHAPTKKSVREKREEKRRKLK